MAGKPKPTKLKLIEGNPGKRTLPDDEPEPLAVAPLMPNSLDEYSKKAWSRLEPILVRNGLLTEADGDNFQALCTVVGKLEVIAEIKAAPDFAFVLMYSMCDSAGNEKPAVKINPVLVEERLLHAQLRQYAPEFGLTPRGRVGLSLGGKEDESPMGKLLN